VRVFFRQKGRNGEYHTDIMVYDNGRGMAPNVLQVATSFGGSMTYGSRSGIGRFGMGMKTAGLSMSPVVEIYSWQPILETNVVDFFIRPMSFPKDRNEQHLLPAPQNAPNSARHRADVMRC
jgi:Histidine kinase-, DNA gyrase B-, and HSP90-like ATPase